VVIISVILAGIFTFWYWYFRIRKQPPEEPEQPEQIEVSEEIKTPEPLFFMEETQIIKFSVPEVSASLIGEVLKEEQAEGEFKYLILKKENKDLELREFFQILSIKIPEEFYSKVENNFTLFVYSQPQGKRLGFVVKTKDSQGLTELMSAEEGNLEQDFKNFFALMDQEANVLSSKFKEGPNFRYLTLSENDLGICYTIFEDKFVFTSSWQSMEKALERL